ncbi:MAG: ABC transporter ATP-binding protein [Elusimicrobia bacterium]|nr:ABC transporter ATP-binding protein [Elusimicrobiota bacterium]
MNPIILDGVTRTFDGRRVLDGLTAQAGEGKVIGLLGRNGEGKTTLFKVLLDLLAPDAGRVEVLGDRLNGSGKVRRRVGYVPERPFFHDGLTVASALDLRAKLFDRWDAGRAGALCGRLGLSPDARVAGASKGTLGKLAWVCAAAHDPSLYLLDEPTSGLDALVREEVLSGLVAELGEAGKTVLIASHRLDEFAGLLDEVWVMAGGKIAGTYDAEALRTGASRITGRPGPGFRAPDGVAALGTSGPVGAWAALDDAARGRLLAAGLESADEEALPMTETLKALLTIHGGAR